MRTEFLNGEQGQEVITSDCVTLKLTAVAQWLIVDAEKFHVGAANSQKALYTFVQLALRQVVGGISLDGIIEKKTSFGQALLEMEKPPSCEGGFCGR